MGGLKGCSGGVMLRAVRVGTARKGLVPMVRYERRLWEIIIMLHVTVPLSEFGLAFTDLMSLDLMCLVEPYASCD